ncbi:MAG TPA: hypothetical protein VHM31_22165 [Polyangia bacterium]|nr:hypothetical protein [Polyangia bacterium]
MNERNRVRRGRRVTFALLGALLAVSCTNEPAANDPSVGQVQLALTLPDGTSVNTVEWKVLSSSSAVVSMGTLNTSGTRTPSFISSLPAGTGYTVSMTATTSANVTCTGTSAAFTVTAGLATPVSVNLLCSGLVADAGTLGSVVVTGSVVPGDHCPALTAWFIAPQSATGTTPIDVSVTATDADSGETLTYAWTAGSGTFASAGAATTQYTCGTAGSQTLSVAITDSHAPAACTTTVMFPAVTCM